MIKKIITLVLLLPSCFFFQGIRFGEAKGLFMSVAVGPKIPIGDFAETSNLGVGFDFAISYTDNEFLPVFLYTKIGYQHFPGAQDFYKQSDYSAFSSNVLTLNLGIRHYLPPIVKDVVILMPVIEAGLSLALIENSHQFKLGTNKDNFVEQQFKTGFHIGGGFSMFLLDVMGYYNYFHNNQYIAFDFAIRIPIYVTF